MFLHSSHYAREYYSGNTCSMPVVYKQIVGASGVVEAPLASVFLIMDIGY